jgi:hypothetical protein
VQNFIQNFAQKDGKTASRQKKGDNHGMAKGEI